ncbi:cobalt ABC transporter permease [Helicobacter sp. 16-1353]|nr:cobalt ABC transporter permease [Helicobacter sp. 16-1353]
MNLSCGLIALVLFSFKVALSNSIDLIFILPIILLGIIRYKEIFIIFKNLFFLNLFIVLVGISVSLYGNFHQALVIFGRSNLIILFSLLVFHKSNAFDVAFALNRLKIGSKASSIFYFCIKFIEEFRYEFIRLKKTLKARGFIPTTSLFTYKIYANLVAMLFINAFYKAEILEKTFIIRNFKGRFFHQHKQKIGFVDILLIILCICIYIFHIKIVL